MMQMFQQIDQFFRAHFGLLFAMSAVFNIGVFIWLGWRREQYGPKFPAMSKVMVRFQETFGSGYSHKSLYTRLGGASRCLKIIVTTDELWVTSFPPFSCVVWYFDLEHRIPLTNLTNVEQQGRWLHVEFDLPDGQSRRLSLHTRRADALMAELTGSCRD